MTATAAESPLTLERRDRAGDPEIDATGAELPVVRERSVRTLMITVVVAEMSWLGAIFYGIILLAR